MSFRASSADEIMTTFIAERGDVFSEVRLIAEHAPRTVQLIRRCAGYVHGYPGQHSSTQLLSHSMRELIALSQLCAMRDDRFAPSHVRRLYRLGVADNTMIEAAEAIAPAVGNSTILHVALAIEVANGSDYPFGAMPEAGPPLKTRHFPEMDAWPLPRDGRADDFEYTPRTWDTVAELDDELRTRVGEFVTHCMGGDRPEPAELCVGARELIVVPALCARGSLRLAASHVRNALAYGVTERHLLDAVACVIPMTGAATMDAFVDVLDDVRSAP